jgi:hypothetical protein
MLAFWDGVSFEKIETIVSVSLGKETPSLEQRGAIFALK